ncbi:MAG: hypothetical protein PHD95_02880 [Candidatus ainarchaeum sp.]|nr:hypothetical protein [Candidatus ainarchaeum sp.]
MKKVDFQEIVAKAKNLAKYNKTWHFHMLGRDCKFNNNRGKFRITFEDESSGKSFYSVFDNKPIKESKKLADLMYGQGFLRKKEKGEHNPEFDLILKKAKELTEQGIEWHHHHLHPNCIFNKLKGKHCIVLEDPKTPNSLIAVYNQKPMEDLVKIEKLFYKDSK